MKLRIWALALVAMALTSLGVRAESLTNLVTITADSVTFDPSVLTSVFTIGIVVLIAAGLALAIGVFVGKWAWRILKGFLGMAK